MTLDNPSSLAWYFARDGVRLGPYSIEHLRSLLATGELAASDMVWRKGDAKWVRVEDVAELVPPPPPSLREAVRAQEPSPLPQSPLLAPPDPVENRPVQSPTAVSRPWNPVVIAYLGLIFTPMWSGVMAALNGSRLGSACPAWRPLLIGFGYLLVSVLLGMVIDSTLCDWILYLAAGAVMWLAVLRDQAPLFDRWKALASHPASS